MTFFYCLGSFMLGTLATLGFMAAFLCKHEYEIENVHKIVHTWNDEPSHTEWIYVLRCKHCGKIKKKIIKG